MTIDCQSCSGLSCLLNYGSDHKKCLLSGAGTVLNALQVAAGTSIAVFGAGAVGLSAVMAAAVAGCTTIIGVDIIPERLELARELGATHVINAAEKNLLVEEI